MYTGTMYSGTLIRDLKAAVEQAERLAELRVQQTQLAEAAQIELQSIFGMHSTQLTQEQQIFAGAA
jgi:hypothetical protein